MAHLEWLGAKEASGTGCGGPGQLAGERTCAGEVLVGGSELPVGHGQKNLSGELLAT